MLQFRWPLIGAILSLSLQLAAAPRLTTIQDTLFRADGSHFNGLVIVTWDAFEAADHSNVAAQTLRIPVINGYFRVQLVPTTDAITTATYSVRYNSDGKIQFSEIWAVPPSSSLLRVKDVRTGPGTVIPPPPLQNSIQITDVTGLRPELNVRPVAGIGYANSRAAVIDGLGSLNGAIGNLSDCVRVDGSSGPCGGGSSVAPGFVDGEAPSGILNGVNLTFVLSSAPNPAASLSLYRNGLLLRPGADYTLAGATVTFPNTAPPQPNDALQASYRLGASIPGVAFVDGETPAGAVDGFNNTFNLTQAPAPVASLALYRNGVRLKLNVDYGLLGSVVVFAAGATPQSGDILVCSYRMAR